MPVRVETVPPGEEPLTVLPAVEGARVEATAYRDGPLVVRGRARVLCRDGTEVCLDRAVAALCRCGKSGVAPFCDGTHKVIGFRAAGRCARDAVA